MKLLRFNLLFLPLLALALGTVAFTARQLLRENARQQIVENARIMMETATSSRTYTTRQVAPLQIFNYLRGKYPDYFYKEATLNPTNPRNRATDWETDIVNQFRGNPKLGEYLGTRGA